MASTFGITKITGTLINSVDVTHSAETKQLINASGQFAAARNVDDSFQFSVSGFGDLPSIAVGDNSGAPDGVSGKIVITKVTLSESNDDWNKWSYDGTAYAHAS